ncbi:unnamed protein product [Rhizophagus irregularis]|nr:unnamed protein product [Rhizophagus irregularis]
MYTIHALIGGENNSHVFPMVYSLMTSKSKESYEHLFQELVDFGKENNQILFPPLIISDFEQVAINAAQIQALRLAVEYGESEDFSIKLCHITALAFLPSSEIPNAFDQVKSLMPPNAVELVQYFEDNYVHGKVIRRHQHRHNQSVIRNPPQFPQCSGLCMSLLKVVTQECKTQLKDGINGGVV